MPVKKKAAKKKTAKKKSTAGSSKLKAITAAAKKIYRKPGNKKKWVNCIKEAAKALK